MAYTRNTHAGVKANVMKRRGNSNRAVRAALRGNLSKQARDDVEHVLLMYAWDQWLQNQRAKRNANHAATALRNMRKNSNARKGTRRSTRSTSSKLYTHTPSLLPKRR